MIFTEDIKNCLDALRKEQTIIYPTDTVWGIGCDPESVSAVASIFEMKHRPDAKSMLLLAADIEMVTQYVSNISEIARRLVAEAVRPVTIIYPGAHGIAHSLIAPDGSVGFRIPKDPFCIELCRQFGKPVVSTSANISGQPTPHDYAGIDSTLLDNAGYVCRCRREQKEHVEPSDIYKISENGEIITIREAKKKL